MKTNYWIKSLYLLFFLGLAPLAIAQIQITNPLSRAVFQRNSSNQATLYIAGNYTQKMDRIEARFTPVQPGQGIATSWTTILVNPLGGNFIGAMTVAGGWYQMEVRGLLNGVQVGNVATLDRVGVGEVFVIAGQSNAQGIGIFDNAEFDYQAPASTDDRVNAFSYRNASNSTGDQPVPTFSRIGSRDLIAPRGETAWCWGKLGDLLATRLNVPVVFFNAAWAATAVRGWRESAAGQITYNIYNSSIAYPAGMPYGNLKVSLQQYAAQYGVRAVLWHQGETDSVPLSTSPVNPTTKQNYAQDLQYVINKTRSDTGKDITWVVARASLNFYIDKYVTTPAIIEGQNQVISTASNVFTGPNTDGIQVPRTDIALVHFWGQGLTDVANAWNTSLDNGFFINSKPQLPTGMPLINATCGNNGNLTLSLPQGYASYVWSTGQTTPSITVNPGTYYARVRDALGNTVVTHSVTIPEDASINQPIVTADGSTTLCAGGSVKLTSSNPTNNVWSNGSTAQTITVSSAGTYSVTARNIYGCVATSNPITVTNFPTPPPAAPTIVSVGSTTFCQGGSVQLVSNYNGRTIWSTGAEGQSITVIAGGTYYARSVDAFGCTSTQSNNQNVVISPTPSKPFITRSGPAVFCGGGSVTLTSNYPTGNQWSNGSTNPSITVSNQGNYSVSYTNANGCKSAESDAITVTINPLPSAPAIVIEGSTSLCQGESVTLNANPSAAYFWTTGETTRSIKTSVAGSFSLFIIDVNGCRSPQSEVITTTVKPLPAAPAITSGGATTFCPGGSVNLSSTSGLGYLWSNGATSQNISADATGVYTARIRDANGCLSFPSNPIPVNVLISPAAPTITPSGTTVFCAGSNVILTSSPASSYAWSNGATDRSITVSATNNLTLIVKDGTGCESAPSSAKVTVNPLPSKPAITTSGQTTLCQGESVTLSSDPSVSYRWNTGANTQKITVSSSGKFAVQVIDSNGCKSPASDSMNVVVNQLPTKPVIAASGPTTFCADKNVILTASSDENYKWSNGATTRNITVNTAGSFTVQAVNKFGCLSPSSEAIKTAINPLPAPLVTTANGPTTFCKGASVTLCANTETPTWSTGETTACITVKETGNYSATITDKNSCVSPPSTAIKVTAQTLPSRPTIEQIGAFTLEAVGAVVGDDYQWKYNGTVIPNVNTRIIKATKSGAYEVSTRITYTAPAPINQIVCLSEPSQKTLDLPNVDISVYPNPNNTGIFKIETKEDLTDAEVKVFTLSGELVYEAIVPSFNERRTIDLSRLMNAPYMLQVKTGGFKGSRLIILLK